MASTLANNFLVALANGEVDLGGDTFKMILMQSGFTFDRTTDDLYSDVSASELATAYGYTVGGATMSGVAVTQNDTDHRADITWSNVTWNISGGDITACGAIIYDDTHASDIIVGYIDFGGDETTLNGGTATVANVEVRIAG